MTVTDQLLEISKNNPIQPNQLMRAKYIPAGLYIEVTNLPADTMSNYRFYLIEPTDDIIGEMTARRSTDDLKCRVAPNVLCRAIDLKTGRVLTNREINRFRPDGGFKENYIAVIYNIDDDHDEVIWFRDVRPTQIDMAGLRALIKERLGRQVDDFDYQCCLEIALIGSDTKGETSGQSSGCSDGVQAHRE